MSDDKGKAVALAYAQALNRLCQAMADITHERIAVTFEWPDDENADTLHRVYEPRAFLSPGPEPD